MKVANQYHQKNLNCINKIIEIAVNKNEKLFKTNRKSILLK